MSHSGLDVSRRKGGPSENALTECLHTVQMTKSQVTSVGLIENAMGGERPGH